MKNSGPNKPKTPLKGTIVLVSSKGTQSLMIISGGKNIYQINSFELETEYQPGDKVEFLPSRLGMATELKLINPKPKTASTSASATQNALAQLLGGYAGGLMPVSDPNSPIPEPKVVGFKTK